jgi:hypothetical protein
MRPAPVPAHSVKVARQTHCSPTFGKFRKVLSRCQIRCDDYITAAINGVMVGALHGWQQRITCQDRFNHQLHSLRICTSRSTLTTRCSRRSKPTCRHIFAMCTSFSVGARQIFKRGPLSSSGTPWYSQSVITPSPPSNTSRKSSPAPPRSRQHIHVQVRHAGQRGMLCFHKLRQFKLRIRQFEPAFRPQGILIRSETEIDPAGCSGCFSGAVYPKSRSTDPPAGTSSRSTGPAAAADHPAGSPRTRPGEPATGMHTGWSA